MIEVDGEVLRTERQWERMHRHVRKAQLCHGVERSWQSPRGRASAAYYREDQTRPWTERERRAERRERERRRRDEELRRAREEAAAEARRRQLAADLCAAWDLSSLDGLDIDEVSAWHTAKQWVSMGFVPSTDERDWCRRWYGHAGEEWSWWCCDAWHVRWDPRRAAKLMETGPREPDRLPDGTPYDGRPWWSEGPSEAV